MGTDKLNIVHRESSYLFSNRNIIFHGPINIEVYSFVTLEIQLCVFSQI